MRGRGTTMEAEVGVRCFNDGGRGCEPRHPSSFWKLERQEIDSPFLEERELC
jgi:hypothetical protein